MIRHDARRALTVAACGLAGVLFVDSGPTEAYQYECCDGCDDAIKWGEGCCRTADMEINTISFARGGTWDTALGVALGHWNAVESSSFRFTVSHDDERVVELGDGDNQVYFIDIADDGVGDTLAVTLLDGNYLCPPFDDADIHEADVEFDSDETWYTGAFSYTSASISVRMTAAHEFGHALGLDHQNGRLTRMNSLYPCGGPVMTTLSPRPLPDDRQGTRFLYPEDDDEQADLVASNFESRGGGFSNKVDTTTVADPGDEVTIEYTFMNLGTVVADDFDIGFYLSEDDRIREADVRLGRNSGARVSAGNVVTSQRLLTIPADTAPGDYFLGIILDLEDDVDELNDFNNSLPQWRTITIR
jgi:hypothetical protein